MAQESTKLTIDSTNNPVDLKVAPKGDNIISEVSPSAERHELAGIPDQKSNPLSKDCIGVQNKQSTLSRSRTKVHLPLQITSFTDKKVVRFLFRATINKPWVVCNASIS